MASAGVGRGNCERALSPFVPAATCRPMLSMRESLQAKELTRGHSHRRRRWRRRSYHLREAVGQGATRGKLRGTDRRLCRRSEVDQSSREQAGATVRAEDRWGSMGVRWGLDGD